LETIDLIPRKQYTPPKITRKHLWRFDKTQNALLNSPFYRMPPEIMLKIFGLLSIRDLENISLVCRYFKIIIDHDSIWKTMCNSKLNLSSLFKIH
jgi:hypothetical protein